MTIYKEREYVEHFGYEFVIQLSHVYDISFGHQWRYHVRLSEGYFWDFLDERYGSDYYSVSDEDTARAEAPKVARDLARQLLEQGIINDYSGGQAPMLPFMSQFDWRNWDNERTKAGELFRTKMTDIGLAWLGREEDNSKEYPDEVMNRFTVKGTANHVRMEFGRGTWSDFIPERTDPFDTDPLFLENKRTGKLTTITVRIIKYATDFGEFGYRFQMQIKDNYGILPAGFEYEENHLYTNSALQILEAIRGAVEQRP